MSDIVKKIFILSIIGFIAGILIGAWIIYLEAPNGLVASATSLEGVLTMLFSGIYGALAMGSTVVYDMESWSILKATVVHFLVTMIGLMIFFAVGIAFGEIEMPTKTIVIIMSVCFVGAYFIIWLVQYLIYKHKVKKMNEELREWKGNN